MGSKVSFGRESSGQNTVSELASVAPHAHSPSHEPSVCNQDLEDKRCTEEDLQSRYRDEMKVSELNQTSSYTYLTGSVANFDTVGRQNDKQNEQHKLSKVGVEKRSCVTPASVCSSTTNSHGKPRVLQGRPRKPRKRKLLTEDRTDHNTSIHTAAVQHKHVSTTQPITTLENHNPDMLLEAIEPNLINDSLHGKDSRQHAAFADKVESDDSFVPRRGRGRPKKEEKTTCKNTISKATEVGPAAPPPNDNAYVPTRRLRRKYQPSTQYGNPECHSNADPQSAEFPPEESNAPNCQVVKRRRHKREFDDQVPEKNSKSDDSQQTVCLLVNSTDRTVTEKMHQQKGMDVDNLEGATNGKDTQHFSHAAEEQQQQSNECAPPPRMLPSQLKLEAVSPKDASNRKMSSPALTAQPEKKPNINGSMESQCDKLDFCQSSVDTDLPKGTISCLAVTPTSEEAQKPVDMLFEPKEEDEEVELDRLNPVLQLTCQKSSRNNFKPTLEAESLPDQGNFFKRKRGGKRRRRITVHNISIPKEDNEASQENKWDEKHKPDLDVGEGNVGNQSNLDGDTKVIYIKKGGKTLLKCGYCGRVFKFQSQFIIHQRVHTGERPYKCPECDKGFSKNSNLNLHLKTHRKKHMYHKCPFCGIKFSNPEYASHMEMHAQEFAQEYKNNNEKPNRGATRDNSEELEKTQEKREKKLCQYCGKTFQFQSALVRHVRVHTGEKPYKCDICGKAFGQAYFLRVHELTHWSVKRYNCTRCEKSFTHYSNAKNHTCRPVGGEDVIQPSRYLKPSLTYTCHICKNVFDHLQAFNSHMRDHTGAKLYRCLYCDKLFGVHSEFTAHHSLCKVDRPTSDIKQETTMSLIKYTVPALRCSVGNNSAPVASRNYDSPNKQFQICRKRRPSDANKPFQSTVIRAHPLSHLVSKLNKLDTRSDPRKYLCPACGRLFRHMGRLRAHMFTHSPNQSYTCACCGKTLENWKKLWHHQRIHRQRQGRFACPECGRGFRFIEPYRKHMREHSEFKWVEVRPRKVSQPYQCERCKCSFATLDLLFGHEHCHSSPSEACKNSDFELSLDQSTHPSKKALSNRVNNPTLNLSSSDKDLIAAVQQPPADFQSNIVRSPSLESTDSSKYLSRSHSIKGKQASLDRTNGNSLLLTCRTVKNTIQNASNSVEGSFEGVQCAVCGKAYSALSDLYQHYLQHARGQV